MRTSSLGGKIIREVRGARGYSQAELAIRTGFAKNTLWNWENGVCCPSFDNVVMICEYLGFTVSEAMELTHEFDQAA